MRKEKCIESILNMIPDEYRTNIESLDIKASAEGTRMLIFSLLRDQHLKFKKVIPLIEDRKNISFYTKFKSKFSHVGGFTHVFDKVNEYGYNISPYWPLTDYPLDNFYKNIKNSSPKGTTRNAIIINTHCGIIPIHLNKLYNRLYCIDVDKNYAAEAKSNLRLNKINNCMLFETNVSKWLKEFEDHKYTPPGKKAKIGLAVCDCSLMSKDSCGTLINIEPETVILFSTDQVHLKELSALVESKDNYEKTYETFLNNFYIRKIKRKEKIEE
ncbi:MAG: hypothetical protein WCQ47_01090 [bacterium]